MRRETKESDLVAALNPKHMQGCGWPCKECTCWVGPALLRLLVQLNDRELHTVTP